MTEADFHQNVVDLLVRIARGVEELKTSAGEANPPNKKAADKPGKPGEFMVSGKITNYIEPNAYGFGKFVIERKELSTKRGVIIDELRSAFNANLAVKVTFNEEEKEGGGGRRYFNRYIQTAEVLDVPPGSNRNVEEEAF